MRLLLDESVPGPVEADLERDGHDLACVRLIMRGASDADVLTTAVAQDRILLTYDRDFGKLVFLHLHDAPQAIVLFRDVVPTFEAEANRVRRILTHVTRGSILVAVRGNVRRPTFPAKTSGQ